MRLLDRIKEFFSPSPVPPFVGMESSYKVAPAPPRDPATIDADMVGLVIKRWNRMVARPPQIRVLSTREATALGGRILSESAIFDVPLPYLMAVLFHSSGFGDRCTPIATARSLATALELAQADGILPDEIDPRAEHPFWLAALVYDAGCDEAIQEIAGISDRPIRIFPDCVKFTCTQFAATFGLPNPMEGA
jgi:hypothetical protein